MIKNEREYRITQSRLAKFKETMDYLAEAKAKQKFDVQTLDLQEAATKSMIQTLKAELKEYAQLKAGKCKSQVIKNLGLTELLPSYLIQGRIVLNWTQEDLAKHIGTSKQQIQRYESQDYEAASLATIKKIGDVIREQLSVNQ